MNGEEGHAIYASFLGFGIKKMEPRSQMAVLLIEPECHRLAEVAEKAPAVIFRCGHFL